MKLCKALWLAAMILPLSLYAQETNGTIDYSQERILLYESEIKVLKTGEMEVVEKITVLALERQIIHGIYRDFPTSYRDTLGFSYSVGFKVTSVQKNGTNEPYKIENDVNKVRVKIGSAETTIPTGIYRYTIAYKTARQLGFAPQYTELYWNVTGNDWAFPIDKARVKVTLPGDAASQVQSCEVFTGGYGSKDSNGRYLNREGEIVAETTVPLDIAQGMTIRIRWNPGIVPEPTSGERFWQFIRDNLTLMLLFAGIFGIFIYYLVAWFMVGRDPKKGAIMPEFEPPDNLSPAAIRYLEQMDYDSKIFAAALVSMAVKGYISISSRDDEYTLAVVGDSDKMLSVDEKAIAKELFKGKNKMKLANANHKAISKAIEELKKSLTLTYEKTYFIRNSSLFIGGIVLSSLVLICAIVFAVEWVATFFIIWLAGWTVGVYMLIRELINTWKSAVTKKKGRVGNVLSGIFLTLFSIPFIAAEVFVLGAMLFTAGLSYWSLLFFIGLPLMNIIFYRLLKAPTLAGRKVMDRIDGFQMYLSATEASRMQYLNPPAKTVDVFEKFLPYALAFGFEKNWADYFADTLNLESKTSGYKPSWYSGGLSGFSSLNHFTSSLGGSMSQAISTSSVAPSRGGSGGGGGGGGFSGGGGGGGGGGGW